MDFLGSAAFSKAVQALDTKTGMLVCLKIIKVSMRLVSMKSHVVAMSMSCSHQAPLFIQKCLMTALSLRWDFFWECSVLHNWNSQVYVKSAFWLVRKHVCMLLQ